MAKSKQNSIIGFVLDSTELRAMELSGTPQQPIVTAFGRLPLAPGLVSDGVIQDTGAVAESLKQLLRENGFATKKLLVGMKNSGVLLRTANFPRVPEDKLAGVVLYQAQQFIPIPTAELVLDYIPLGEVEVEERPMVTVLLVGAKKVCLHGVMEVAEKAGLHIVNIDAALLAAGRSVADRGVFEDAPFLMVHIDYEMVSFAVMKEDQMILTRSIALPAELAELLASGSHQGTLQDREAAAALQNDLIASLNFFTAQGEELENIYLVGQYPSLNGLAGQLSALTGLSVEVPQLYPMLRGIDTLAYGSCIALALRGLEEGAV